MRLKAPEGVAGVGFEGQTYTVVKGVVEVPDHATVLLKPGWGFTLIPEPEAPAEAPAEAAAPEPEPKPKTENRKPKTRF